MNSRRFSGCKQFSYPIANISMTTLLLHSEVTIFLILLHSVYKNSVITCAIYRQPHNDDTNYNELCYVLYEIFCNTQNCQFGLMVTLIFPALIRTTVSDF